MSKLSVKFKLGCWLEFILLNSYLIIPKFEDYRFSHDNFLIY